MIYYFIEYFLTSPASGDYERCVIENLCSVEAIIRYNNLVKEAAKNSSGVQNPKLYKVSTECICEHREYNPELFEGRIYDDEGV